MIRSLRAFFLSRLLREKLLLLAFIGIGTLWWLSAFASRASAFSREQRSTTAALAEQQLWLNDRAKIEAAAESAAARLDPARTYSASRLSTEIRNLASQAGLRSFNTVPQPSVPNVQFSFHTLTFTASNVDWDGLKKFYQAVQTKVPYIGIDQFTLTLGNNGTHSINMRISSVEIVR
jgi:hypothetical protein